MSWNRVKLGDLFEQYRVEHNVQDNVEYGQITISQYGYVKFRAKKLGKTIGRKRQFIIDLKNYPNTLLFTRQGVADGAIGFAPEEVDGCIATENMPMFSLKENISKRFIELLVNSQQYKDELKKIIPTGSAQKSIHERDLLKIELLIPNYDEQVALVNNFQKVEGDILELNSEVDYQQNLLTKLKQSILQEAIEGKLTSKWREENQDIEPASILLEKILVEKEQLIKDKKIKKSKPLAEISEDETPFYIPTNWEWCRLGELCNYEQGIQVDLHLQKKEYEQGLVPFLRIVDFTQNTDDLRYIKCPGEKYHIDKQNLVMVRYGATAGFVGDNKQGVLANNLFKIHYGLLNKDLLKIFFQTLYFNRELSNNTKGVAMPAISFKFLDLLLFPLIPLEEQKEIVNKVEKLFAICDELEEQINSSIQNTQSLMQSVLKEAFER